MDYQFFERLRKHYPGAVDINRSKRTVILRGLHLKEFVHTSENKDGPGNVYSDTGETVSSGSTGKDVLPECILFVNGSYERVIYPLSNPDQYAAERNETGSRWWILGKHPGAGKQENEAAEGYQDFVPGIKGKLRKWVKHLRSFLFDSTGKY